MPKNIGDMLSTIGVAGTESLVRFRALTTSGHAAEAAGGPDTLRLDKT